MLRLWAEGVNGQSPGVIPQGAVPKNHSQGSFPKEQCQRIIPRDHSPGIILQGAIPKNHSPGIIPQGTILKNHSPRSSPEESFPKEQSPGQGRLRVEHVTKALPELGTRVEEETSPLPHSPMGAVPQSSVPGD